MSNRAPSTGVTEAEGRHHMINLYTPLLPVVYFAAASLYTLWDDQDDPPKRPLRQWSKSVVFWNFVVALSFGVQAIYYLQDPVPSLENEFIHDLSQILVWSTLFLSLLSSSSSTNTTVYLPTWLLSMLIEGVKAVVSTAVTRISNPYLMPRVLSQAATMALHLIVVANGLAIVWSHREHGTCEESQSLLGSDSVPSSSSSFSATKDNGGVSDPEDDDSDAEEKEMRAQRKIKLQQSGGWLEYSKSFKVFLPYVFPLQQPRLQLYIVLILINTLLQRALNVINPLQLAIIIDRLTEQHEIAWKNVALWILSAVLANESTGLGALSHFLEERVSTWSRREMYVAAFDRVMGLSMSFHDQKDSGEVIKALEQAGSLNSLFRTIIFDIVPGVLDITIAIWYIGYLFDIYATLILFAVGIAFVFNTNYVMERLSGARRTMTATQRNESKVLYESVSNWATVSYFNRKKLEVDRLSKAANESRIADIWYANVSILMWGSQDLCEQLGRFAISMLALHRIVLGTSTVGKFVALQGYWGIITMPLYILGHSYRELTSDLIDAERLLQIFETPITVKEKQLAAPLSVTKGEVELKDVCFGYEGHKATLQDFSLTARSGQTIALVGETGSGKSTTLKLLMRFYDVTEGSIKIDGQDIRDVTIDSLRDAFGFVPQDSVLFNTSILENVRYGRLDATDEEVYKACEEACIHDRILTFPDGYRSRVGERGVKLSGGERQRIAIARVMLKKPKIVLLDEATSAMDSLTESKIQKALERLMKGQTAFVIAHRLSTVANADMILVLDGGKVIESGTHSQLLKRRGRYVELCKKQEIIMDQPYE